MAHLRDKDDPGCLLDPVTKSKRHHTGAVRVNRARFTVVMPDICLSAGRQVRAFPRLIKQGALLTLGRLPGYSSACGSCSAWGRRFGNSISTFSSTLECVRGSGCLDGRVGKGTGI